MRSCAGRELVAMWIFLLVFSCAGAQQVSTSIRLNQLGFYPNAPKIAIITDSAAPDAFFITSTNLRDTVFTGSLTRQRTSAYSSTKTRIADFSELKRCGSFVLVNGERHSYVFRIANDVNLPAAAASLKGYYYQRVSVPLEEQYAGRWHRSAGHTDTVIYVHPSAADARRPSGTIVSSPGGWYDAGDYNKYIVNSGITMGTLFSAYEDFPAHFKDLRIGIPESSNAVPDVLDEAICNLRWMLTMQDESDGGVYHKCTNAAFDGMVMPGVTKTPRYVVQKGTAATLDFAAVMAQASRLLKSFSKQLPGLSDSCLQAALKAWQWATLHPTTVYDQEKINKTFAPPITTGAYGDRSFRDEWFWAAAELYLTTRKGNYRDSLLKTARDSLSLPSWSSVDMLGCYSLLRFSEKLPAGDKALVSSIRSRLISLAGKYIEKARENAFQTVMGQSARDFNWGGNSNAGNQGILLVNAYLLTADRKYIDFALTNLDYLLGRNATGYCFVTGLGSKPPMFPHHRPSTADGITYPVPGLLVGGPNAGKQDKCEYAFSEIETAYVDSDCSYASNEIAINWNAPLVYLANALEALKVQVNYTVK